MIKQIEILQSDNLETIERYVNDYLIELYKEGINPDDIDILSNISVSEHITYTYTIIYLEED